MKTTSTVILAAFALTVLASGCVWKSDHETLQAQLKKMKSDLKGEIQQKEATIKQLNAEIKKKDAKIKELEGTIAGLKKEGTAYELRLSHLQGKMAAVLKDRSRLKQSAAELKAALALISKRKAEADRRVQQFRDLLNKFKALISAGKLRVKIANGKMVLELPTDVLFASGSAKLSDAGIQAIAEITAILATLTKRRFQVEGHTDNVPIKTARFRSNWELASTRAVGVVKAMVEAGMDGGRISAASFGEFQPVAANDSTEGKTANRRIEIVVVPDLSSLPGFKELQKVVGK